MDLKQLFSKQQEEPTANKTIMNNLLIKQRASSHRKRQTSHDLSEEEKLFIMRDPGLAGIKKKRAFVCHEKVSLFERLGGSQEELSSRFASGMHGRSSVHHNPDSITTSGADNDSSRLVGNLKSRRSIRKRGDGLEATRRCLLAALLFATALAALALEAEGKSPHSLIWAAHARLLAIEHGKMLHLIRLLSNGGGGGGISLAGDGSSACRHGCRNDVT